MAHLKLDSIVPDIWHCKVEDGSQWKSCADYVNQNGWYGGNITPREVKDRFQGFFKKLTGFTVYAKCPECGDGYIKPRKSGYGYFVSCSKFPSCTWKAKNKMRVGDESK